jgi:hypothetical protein
MDGSIIKTFGPEIIGVSCGFRAIGFGPRLYSTETYTNSNLQNENNEQ